VKAPAAEIERPTIVTAADSRPREAQPEQARVGLGLRFEFLDDVLAAIARDGRVAGVDLFEVGPENYARRGGYVPAALDAIRERVPIVSHGLTLDVGGLEPFDPAFLAEIRAFLERVDAPFYSDHLCVSGFDGGHTHDLLPLPLTRGALRHVVARVKEVQRRIERPFALENVSHYLQVGRADMSEPDFIGTILDETGAGLLLDVNNVHVNAMNHGFDAEAFLDALPLEKTVQIHVAGHAWSDEHGIIIDTHGAAIVDPVYALLERAVRRTGPVPVIIERDHHVPELATLLDEAARVRAVVDRALARRRDDPPGGTS
jgi:uncharacterized protein (UPF0276 family)